MIRKLKAVALLAAAFVLFDTLPAGCAELQQKLIDESTIEQAVKRGVLRVGMSTFVPWAMTDKTGNLPDVPAAGIAVNPLNRKQVFLGTYFGFYYTDDIDAATPVWVRYQWGLPNTVIQFLTVDRGATATPLQGTTLMAFTYGRGVYAIKLPAGGASFPAH